jgi:hypothetical protein
MSAPAIDRRDFLRVSAAVGCALLVGGATWLLLLSKADRRAIGRV